MDVNGGDNYETVTIDGKEYLVVRDDDGNVKEMLRLYRVEING